MGLHFHICKMIGFKQIIFLGLFQTPVSSSFQLSMHQRQSQAGIERVFLEHFVFHCKYARELCNSQFVFIINSVYPGKCVLILFHLYLWLFVESSQLTDLNFSTTFICRLHRAQCAIKQTQVTVQKIGKEIEEKLRLTSTSNELVCFYIFACLNSSISKYDHHTLLKLIFFLKNFRLYFFFLFFLMFY